MLDARTCIGSLLISDLAGSDDLGMAASRALLHAGSSLRVHFWDVPCGTSLHLLHVVSKQLSC